MTRAWKLGKDALDRSSGIGPLGRGQGINFPVVQTQFPPRLR